MRVALIGGGRMGRAIAALAPERGHEVSAVLGAADNPRGAGIDRPLGEPDVVIEVTQPDAAVENVLACARAGLPVVVGTTGWYDDLERVSSEVRRLDGALLWAPSFSVGVAVLAVAVEAAATALRDIGGFDAHLVETHHAAKKDQPSGTAAALAERAARALGRPVPITSVHRPCGDERDWVRGRGGAAVPGA